MDDSVMQTKIMGMTPAKYTEVFYYALLGAVLFNGINAVLSLVGAGIGIVYVLANLCLLGGLVMGLLGFFVFRDKLSTLALSHIKFVAIGTFVYLILSNLLIALFAPLLGAMLTYVLVLVIIAVFAGGLYSCLKLWREQTVLTVDAVRAKFLSMTK